MAISFPILSLLILLISSASSILAVGSHVQGPAPSAAALLPGILSNLGFTDLALAVPSLPFSALSRPWSSPVTIFAPSDDTIRSCGAACSPSRLLREHTVSGAFPRLYLSKLTTGTKLQTAAPNRCLTVTNVHGSDGAVKILVEGVEITRPDLFNDGHIAIHGIDGFIPPLSPFSCVFEDRSHVEVAGAGTSSRTSVSVLLRDSIVNLKAKGFSILALAMRLKAPELIELQNMTIFTLDDRSVFLGGEGYLSEVRFHVVPNQRLMRSDLEKLPEGAVLQTLVRRQHLIVTQSGRGLRINYVPIKIADVEYNSRIVVHSLYFPFPHLNLVDQAYREDDFGEHTSACGGAGSHGECKYGVSSPTSSPTPAPAPSPAWSLSVDHHGSL